MRENRASPDPWWKRGENQKRVEAGGCSSSIVLDSKEQPEHPPAEEAVNRLKAGWPGGRAETGNR